MKLGFIGVGNIAAALVEGFCTDEDFSNLEIFLSPRNGPRSSSLATKYRQVTRLESNQEVLDRSEIVFIAVRPPISAEVLQSLRFREDHTVVSLVSLLKYADLVSLVQPAAAVCRAIPMPSVAIHDCPVALYEPTGIVRRLFERLGTPYLVFSEVELHALWTLTGLITPFYELMAGLSGWAVTNGAERNTAREYTAHLFKSLAALGSNFPQLAEHAATPGGLNEQAGREIREAGAHQAWIDAADRLLVRFR